MLTKLEYYKFVLTAFESMEREIQDCKEFTINEYNALVEQQKLADQQTAPTKVEKTTKTTDKKEEK